MAEETTVNINNNNIQNFESSTTGNVTVNMNHLPQLYKKPKYIWFHMKDNVETFSGRSAEMLTIHSILNENQICVICGLGGIGKTEVARKYGWYYREYYKKNVAWINTETTDTLRDLFNKLAIEMNIPITKRGSEREQSSIVNEIYDYFKVTKCLFIFDNALTRRDIQNYMPSVMSQNLYVHILITSQNQEWAPLKCFQLPILLKNDAVELVMKCFTNVPEITAEMRDIEELVDVMQNLPLALQQAAAYIVDKINYVNSNYTVKDYIYKFQKEKCLLDYKYNGAAFPDYSQQDYNKTVFINFIIILEKIKEHKLQLAIDLLYLISYCEPDSITLGLFRPLFPENNFTKAMYEAIRVIEKYSLVNKLIISLSVHRLVQSVIRLHLIKESLEKEVLLKALSLITAKVDDYNPNYALILKFADQQNLIDEYYSICKNKKEFLFVLAYNGYHDNILHILKSVKDNDFLKGDNTILPACTTENIDLIKLLVEMGTDINASYKKKSALDIACSEGNINIVRYLLDQGAHMNSDNGHNSRSLLCAICANQTEVVKFLLSNGTSIIEDHEDIYLALEIATERGHLEIIHFFLSNVLKDNRKKCYSENLLHIASEKGQLAVVKYFLNNGTNVKYKRSNGQTSLTLAVIEGHVEIVQLLLNRGASVYDCWRGQSVLQIAAYNGHLHVVKLLIDSQANISNRDDFGNTALHNACTGGHVLVVEYLHGFGSDLNCQNFDGETPLHIAVLYGHFDVTEFLLNKGIEVNAKDNKGRTVLMRAASRGHHKTVQYLLYNRALVNDKDFLGNSALHFAAAAGHVHVVQLLIDNQARVFARDMNGDTALHRTCNVHVVEYLCNKGSDVNHRNCDGKTPLYNAIEKGRLDIIQCLVSNGANVNDKLPVNTSHIGTTALMRAASSGHSKSVQFLIDNGACINDRDVYGDTALHYACGSRTMHMVENVYVCTRNHWFHRTVLKHRLKVINILLKSGANVNEKNGTGKTAMMEIARHGYTETIQYLLDCRACVNEKDSAGTSALQFAAAAGHLDIVHLLINNQADITDRNIYGDTALHDACTCGNVQVVLYLCRNGSIVNDQNNAGKTALHMAARYGHLPAVKLLVDYGADIHMADFFGSTPLDSAGRHYWSNICVYLRDLEL